MSRTAHTESLLWLRLTDLTCPYDSERKPVISRYECSQSSAHWRGEILGSTSLLRKERFGLNSNWRSVHQVETMTDQSLREALELHWATSDAGDFKAEHQIYDECAVLNYPQSGERIIGRGNILESRYLQPNRKRFTVARIVGSGDLWITEFILTYDGAPSYAVSIMEFQDQLVIRETQYFADPFVPARSRAHLVQRLALD
jgi:hypothetical protein